MAHLRVVTDQVTLLRRRITALQRLQDMRRARIDQTIADMERGYQDKQREIDNMRARLAVLQQEDQ